VALAATLVLHVTAAAQLSWRDRLARPQRYAHRLRVRATYATRTMRWGGIIVALFVVWHLLDLSFGLVNPRFAAGRPDQNVVVDFQVWWINLIYIVAVVLVGLHIQHGFASAAWTLGSANTKIRFVGTAIAALITIGFIAVPIGVMTGLVR
jgi:succinate dehydrogenase / fumarate reductase cytochrome b subunit